jgi:hypothetical protein
VNLEHFTLIPRGCTTRKCVGACLCRNTGREIRNSRSQLVDTIACACGQATVGHEAVLVFKLRDKELIELEVVE